MHSYTTCRNAGRCFNAPLRASRDIPPPPAFLGALSGGSIGFADDGQVSKVGLEVVRFPITASGPAPGHLPLEVVGRGQPSIWATTKLRSSKPWP